MFFSGFSLSDEKDIFKEYIEETEFTISGFSYGAIKALEYVLEAIKDGKRIDKLQLFSPAYFNNESKKFKRMQLMYFKKDTNQYIENFIKNTIYPNNFSLDRYIKNGTYKELEELLNYNWQNKDLELVKESNVEIEVFLGLEDKVIHSKDVKSFFSKYAEIYCIKNVGHCLK